MPSRVCPWVDATPVAPGLGAVSRCWHQIFPLQVELMFANPPHLSQGKKSCSLLLSRCSVSLEQLQSPRKTFEGVCESLCLVPPSSAPQKRVRWGVEQLWPSGRCCIPHPRTSAAGINGWAVERCQLPVPLCSGGFTSPGRKRSLKSGIGDDG